MTELQKLSLKKLRRHRLPLFVLDRKSKRGAFVILDEVTFRCLDQAERVPRKNPPRSLLARFDFRGRGLLWDRPDLSNRQFVKIIKDPHHPEHPWAIARILERLPSPEVLKLFSIEEISAMLALAPVRASFRKPWEHAIEYFHQKTSRPR